MTRGFVSLFAAGLVGVGVGVGAQAEAAWPEQPIRLIVPFPPGGAADFIGRVYAEALGNELDATVIVENRPGASGTVGATMLAGAPADGYSLVLGSVSSHATALTMMPDLQYHPVEDFTPISLVAIVPSLVVSTSQIPPTTFEEFVEYAREHPGELNYGSVGNGTSMHLAGVILSHEAGLDMVHVPYRGQNTLVPDIVSGNVHIVFNNIVSSIGPVQSGELQALAVALPERWPELPDTPTLEEVGYGDIQVSSWTGVFAPAGLDPEIQKILSDASVQALSDEAVRQRILDGGNLPVGNSAEELGAFVAEQVDYWAHVIGLAGIAPE